MLRYPRAMRFSIFVLTTTFLLACGDDATGTPDGGGGGSSGDATTRVEQLLRSDEHTRLVVELDAVPGFAPNASSSDQIIDTLTALVDKPDGVVVTAHEALPARGTDHAYTDDELFALADAHYNLAVGADTAKIHVLFLDGHSARDSDSGRILGLAWANRHLVMFKQTIEDVCASGGIFDVFFRDKLCAATEANVWIHELGHVLGLVNTGIAPTSDHEDPDHHGHDANAECIMYWANDGETVFDSLADTFGPDAGKMVLPFDDACLADLAAIRER